MVTNIKTRRKKIEILLEEVLKKTSFWDYLFGTSFYAP